MILQQTLTMLDRGKSSSSSSKADVMNEVKYGDLLLILYITLLSSMALYKIKLLYWFEEH